LEDQCSNEIMSDHGAPDMHYIGLEDIARPYQKPTSAAIASRGLTLRVEEWDRLTWCCRQRSSLFQYSTFKSPRSGGLDVKTT
jgi:hypothetical protein